MLRPILTSLGICAAAALLETLCAGTDVEQRFRELRLPVYSLPLWGWFVVGGLYYLMCFVVLYRILRQEPSTRQRLTCLLLVVALMLANALWNLVFFRLDQLFLAFGVMLPYLVLASSLFAVLRRVDRVSSWFVVPYLAYLVYVTAWAYGVWRLNTVL